MHPLLNKIIDLFHQKKNGIFFTLKIMRGFDEEASYLTNVRPLSAKLVLQTSLVTLKLFYQYIQIN